MLVVPRVVVGRRAGQCWVTEFEAASATEPVIPVSRPRGVRYFDGELPVTAWRDAVARAVSRMRAGSGPAKVVLAHDLLAVAEEPLDPRFLLHGLAARYPSCWTFAVDQLVGATPELLLRRRGTEVVVFQPTPEDLRAMGLTLMDAARRRAVVRQAMASTRRRLRSGGLLKKLEAVGA